MSPEIRLKILLYFCHSVLYLAIHACSSLSIAISNARIDSTSRSLLSLSSPVSLDTLTLTPALLPNAQPYIFLLAGHRFLVPPTQGEGVPGVATAVRKTRPCGGWHCFWKCVGILPHSYIQKLQKRKRRSANPNLR